MENSDLQMRIDGESGKNHELNQAITEMQVKIRQKEDHISYLKQELQAAQQSNGNYVDTTSSLKVEIDSLNQHIAKISHANEELTRELDSFVKANEEIRMRLDRKQRVTEVVTQNDAKVQSSAASAQASRVVTGGGVSIQGGATVERMSYGATAERMSVSRSPVR